MGVGSLGGFFYVFESEGLEVVRGSEVEGDSFELVENLLLEGSFVIEGNDVVILLDYYVDNFLCLLIRQRDCLLHQGLLSLKGWH